jgi:hypothetical protein
MSNASIYALAAFLCAALPASAREINEPQSEAKIDKPIRLTLLCLLTGEQVSGLNKICYYDCAGSGAAITIASYQLCPININK